MPYDPASPKAERKLPPASKTMACADCGDPMWRGHTSAPEGQARCQPCRRERPMRKRSQSCARCGATLTRANQKLYCSIPCANAANVRKCTPRTCEACGEPYRARISGQRSCSRWCGIFVRLGYWPSSKVTERPRSRPVVEPKAPACRVFLPDCVICGKVFATPYTIMTCSSECAEVKRRRDKRIAGDRRRARKRDAYVADVWRTKVYERDGWRCHICGRKVQRDAVVPHPLAPTLDHLIPLARGGTHEPANVATAHFRCNALKGDRGGGEQLALVG